ncbi:MAG: hypothetical protein H7124_02435 [Phycisphaerales bacterium]|nr:hypothetical protein [Hyphomonadaceae bacterium]
MAMPDAPANDPRPPDGATIGQGVIHMPEPHITVAPTQEYVLALVVLLMQLRKARRDVVFEMMLLLAGVAAGSVLPSVGVLIAWARGDGLNFLGFLTCMLLSAAASGALVCWRIVRKKGTDFEDTMTEIMKGQRFDSRGNSIAQQTVRPTQEGQSIR